MTELEIMIHAKKYMDKLAHGINPLTDEAIPEDEVVNHVRISRCFFYVSDVLRRVIEKGGLEPLHKPKSERKLPFALDHSDLMKFEYSDKPLPISYIAQRINQLVDASKMKKLSYRVIRNWLLEIEMLEEAESEDGTQKLRPTEQGNQMGIFLETRMTQYGNSYDVVVYDRRAQQFIIENLIDVVG